MIPGPDPADASPPRPAFLPQAPRILVALRDAARLREAAAALDALGMVCKLAGSAREALAAHAAHPCDLIVVDAAFAEDDGFALAPRLRMLTPTLPRIPLIACAAGMTASRRNALLRADIDDVCTPPLVATQLGRLLQLWLPSAHDGDGSRADAGLRGVADLLGADFAGIVRMFHRDSQERIAAMRMGIAREDAPGVAAVAHALGGSSASIGGWRMAGLCRALELQCLAGRHARLPQLLDALESEYSRLSLRLRQLPEARRPDGAAP
jgi:CheY-like chemotaxis protein